MLTMHHQQLSFIEVTEGKADQDGAKQFLFGKH